MKTIKVKFYETVGSKPVIIKGKSKQEVCELLELMMNEEERR